MKKSTRAWLLLLTLFGGAGCSMVSNVRDVDKKIQQNSNAAKSRLTLLQRKQPVLREASQQWINTTPLAVSAKKTTLPSCPIEINSNTPLTLSQIAQRITETCQIPVTITPDVWTVLSGERAGHGQTQQLQGAIPAPDPNGMLPLATLGATQPTMPVAPVQPDTSMRLNVSGLSSLVNTVTARLGISWRYEGGRLTFFYLEARTFPITFMDAQVAYNAKVVTGTTASSDENSTNANSSNTETTSAVQSTLYSDLKNAINTMLTPGLGRMSLSTGFLTVRDNPVVLDAVAEFVKQRNHEMSRQAQLTVRILSVKKKKREQIGLDWNAVFKDSSLALGLKGAVNEFTNPVMTGNVSIVDGKWAGSEAFIKALSSQGDVSLVTESHSVTKNLIAVTPQVGTRKSFIKNSSIENTANVGTSQSFNDATLTTGFNMTLIPFIHDDQHLQLFCSINLSDKPKIENRQGMQLPEVDFRAISQSVDLKDGQSIIISGFQQTNLMLDKKGVGSSSFWGLGGGVNAENEDTILVAVITPTIL